METVLDIVNMPGLVGLLEIAILAIVFYYVLVFFRGTRGESVMAGVAIVFIVLSFTARFFNMNILYWLTQKVMVYLAVGLIVIFQPEIRRALAYLGRSSKFSRGPLVRGIVDAVSQSAAWLSDQKLGGLILIEREIGTRGIQETGVALNARISPELLTTIFYPKTPLHDGGVIISGNKIIAAGCLFPLTQKEISKALGMRHRAAVGITEETDALVVVVSEETGVISVAYNGRLRRGLDKKQLRRVVSSILNSTKGSRWMRVWQDIADEKDKTDLS